MSSGNNISWVLSAVVLGLACCQLWDVVMTVRAATWSWVPWTPLTAHLHSTHPLYGDATMFVERDSSARVSQVFEVSAVLERRSSRFQLGEVLQMPALGKVLVLDGILQLAEADEANYHEMMVHVPMAYSPHATRVLVIGGGDGAGLSRLVQYPHLQHITIVDLDPMVEQLCRTHFPHWAAGFDDPRVTKVYGCGAKWARAAVQRAESFDVIIVDSTDFGVARPLFTSEFYTDMKSLLVPGGLFLANVDSPSFSLHAISRVSQQLASLYTHAHLLHLQVPSFASGHYSFMLASDAVHPFKTPVDWPAWLASNHSCEYYTPDLHYAAFVLPERIRRVVHGQLSLADIPVQPR